MGNNNSFHHAWTHAGAPKKGNFSKKLSDGTSIFGNKRTEGKPGFQHGHSGANFHRSPYSALGTAALGKPRSYDNHKKNNTVRW
jgi:hypothetical protein